MPYTPIDDSNMAAWLTTVLREAQVLPQGQRAVTAVESTTMSAVFNSHTSRLQVQYSPDVPATATATLPTRFVLKRNIAADWGLEAGEDEVRFYNHIASLHDHPAIIIPCYAAAHDPESRNSYVLLQDLSETHAPPLTRDQQISIVEGIPSPTHLEGVIDTLAQLHAYWWQHPLQQTNTFEIGYWSRNQERFEQYLQRRTRSWEDLITHESAWFPADLRALYEQALTQLPAYWERYLQPRFEARKHLTLSHGDAYFANFLSPRGASSGTTYLLDWQSYSFDVAAEDLVNMCASFWTSQQRNEGQRELHILRRYHTRLQNYGVRNYSWDDLLTDYRMGLIYWLLMPVQDRYGGANKDYWWPKMQCLVTAFREWHCEELLSTTMN